MGQIISHVHVRGVRKQYVFDYNLNHHMHAGLRPFNGEHWAWNGFIGWKTNTPKRSFRTL